MGWETEGRNGWDRWLLGFGQSRTTESINVDRPDRDSRIANGVHVKDVMKLMNGNDRRQRHGNESSVSYLWTRLRTPARDIRRFEDQT